MIRIAKISEIKKIKKLVDSFKEMDVTPETFSEEYYRRILKMGILLVAIENNKIIGICFGIYNSKEKWADLLGLVVKKEFQRKGFGKELTREFEKIARIKKLKTIDLYANKKELGLFRSLGYKQGRDYAAFHKRII